MSPAPGPKVVAVQHAHPTDPPRDVPAILAKAARSVADGGIAVLPEYFYKPADRMPAPETLEALTFVEDAVVDATEAIDGALVATVPELDGEAAYNTAVVAEDGQIVHRQRKVRPTEPERKAGIRPSRGLSVAEVQGVGLGVLVCADVLALDLLVEMAHLQPDVVAVPVLSPNRGEVDPTRVSRTDVFVARAWDMGAYVVKAGGHAEPRVVGRSLITCPWGVQAQARDQYRDTLLAAEVDLGTLASVRRDFEGLGDA